MLLHWLRRAQEIGLNSVTKNLADRVFLARRVVRDQADRWRTRLIIDYDVFLWDVRANCDARKSGSRHQKNGDGQDENRLLAY
ncbi:MAG: hypothetical protein V3V96_08715, partial [Acidiferrobacterales bacterium]